MHGFSSADFEGAAYCPRVMPVSGGGEAGLLVHSGETKTVRVDAVQLFVSMLHYFSIYK